MGPRRKKSKQPTPQQDTNTVDGPPQPEVTPLSTDQNGTASSEPTNADSSNKEDTNTPDTPVTPTSQAGNRGSWYKGGSWRSKASPVAQATRENISVAGGATSEALAEGPKQTGRYVHSSLRRSTKSIPTISSDSTISATGKNADSDKPKFFSDNLTKAPSKDKVVNASDLNGNAAKNESTTKDAVKEADVKTNKAQVEAVATTSSSKDLKPLSNDVNSEPTSSPVPEAPLPPEPTKDSAQGWWGWWSRPDGYSDQAEKLKAQDDDKEASSTPLPTTPDEAPADSTKLPAEPLDINKTINSVRSVETATSSRSWFRLWSNTQNQQQAEEQQQQQQNSPAPEEAIPTDPPATEAAQNTINTPPSKPAPPEAQQVQGTPQNKSAGWAFWSRADAKGESATPNGTQRQIGELAVADTPSQSHPEAAQFNEQRQQKDKSTKLGRSASVTSTASLSSPSQPRLPVSEAAKGLETTKNASDAAKPLKPQPHPNLVIPDFDDTYSPAYVPSYRERLTSYVASTLRLIDAPPAPRHVSITPTQTKIKNAIAIGVHGYFPAPLIQKVLGQPTGTSIRFANYASKAIRDWVEANQPDSPCEIETVALEGEGFIADRVATLWKLLLNWLSHLRQADLIFVACHSQGVPVAIMLIHKLLQLGCLSPHARIGICAMAGVNLGPFADYKSRLLGAGSAAELFEFSKKDSRVSTEYKSALDGVLRHGVRITYCGSIDDQLVSLESSTFTTLTHPYIYRAVFVDGRLHAPNFLTHLVAFALKLRNLNISDHGLIRELSLPLAGSLYSGEGHSRIYDDPAVYTLSLRFTLETTSLASPPSGTNTPLAQSRRSSRGGPPESVSAANSLRRGSLSASEVKGIMPEFADYEVPASGSNANPYFLPWALRGILEEEVVKRDLQDEVQVLVKEFEEWRPSSKVLKDVRFRLEGVRSKL